MEDFLKWLWGGVITYGLLIITIIVTFVMALMRTKKNQGKADWIEACMCAIFAYSLWLILDWLNLPQDVSVLLGTFIAYKGTHEISNKIESWLRLDKR